jgi:hypothetical protein
MGILLFGFYFLAKLVIANLFFVGYFWSKEQCPIMNIFLLPLIGLFISTF